MITVLFVPLAASAPLVAGASTRRLVWSGEFNGSRMNRRKWGSDTDCTQGGDDECECYTDRLRNLSVERGALTIAARPERATSSAKMRGDFPLQREMPVATT